MTWISLQRVMELGRRSRRLGSATAPGAVHPEGPRRDTAIGIDFSPVHGRHCICQRCERQSRTAA